MDIDRDSNNYFQLFNLQEKFDLNEQTLENNYIALQNTCHPDRFFTDKEKELAFRKAQEINNAYYILKSPISRAEYLLKVVHNATDFVPNTEVLTELFALQEDISSSDKNTEQLITNLNNKYLLELSQSFENMNIFSAQKSVLFLRYLLKLK